MKTIIAAIDFSANAINAAFYAADLAKELGCELKLLHVVEIPVAIDVAFVDYNAGETMEDSENNIYRLKDDILEHTQNSVVVCCEVTSGSVPFELQSMEKDQDIVAIVMGQDDPYLLYRMLTGSHTLATVKNVKSPVLVVPANCSYNGIKHIVMAYDFKDSRYFTSLQVLRDWLKFSKAKVDILHVCPEDKMKADVVSNSILLEDNLFEFHPQFHYIDGKNVHNCVQQFVNQNQPDLLIVLPKKYGFFERLFHKSQSQSLLLNTHIPILAIQE